MDYSSIFQEANDWTEALEPALRRVENTIRHERGLKPRPPSALITIATQMEQKIRLLNWKIWGQRYNINVQFIMYTLLIWYRNVRRIKDVEPHIHFGMPIPNLTGERARSVIEEAVARQYPNRENYRAANQPRQSPPMLHLRYLNPQDMIEQYRVAIAARQQARLENKSLRPYRGR